MKGYLNGKPISFSGSGGESSTVPSGAIVMWANREIPDGWAICNGENGTPDLRDRFVLSSGSKNLGAVGGEETVTLTTTQMPRHRHSYYNTATTTVNPSGNSTAITPGGATYTGYEGSGQPHNNMPPYYVLYFIMKL